MKKSQYQHEIVVPSKGFPFKIFLFEGGRGNYVREKHWHRSIEIFSVQKGSLDFILNDKIRRLYENEIVIVNSNEVHAIHALKPNYTIVLQIPLNMFFKYYTDEQFIWFSHNSEAYDGVIINLIEKMYESYRSKDEGYDLQVLSLFYELQYILVSKYRKLDVHENLLKSNRQLKRLGMITEYIKDHYTEEISLDKLAHIFGYAPSYLSRMFQKYAKINYKEYLQSIRLEYALKELEETDNPIGEIALNHGFPNNKSLSNLFKKRYGMPPNEYRKNIRQKSDMEWSSNR